MCQAQNVQVPDLNDNLSNMSESEDALNAQIDLINQINKLNAEMDIKYQNNKAEFANAVLEELKKCGYER